jgi:hypothetical protein
MLINGFGFLFKSIQSTGIIRKKFLLLSIGSVLLCTFLGLEQFPFLGIYSLLFRIGILISFWCTYLGLKEEPAEVKEIAHKKEIEVEESLFRLTKRPAQITEEEVSISKEKKICLVCKGKLIRFNIYICPGCDVLYCENCAHTLSNLENTCWMCNTPFNESKPVKPFKKDEAELEIERIEKKQATNKNLKKDG